MEKRVILAIVLSLAVLLLWQLLVPQQPPPKPVASQEITSPTPSSDPKALLPPAPSRGASDGKVQPADDKEPPPPERLVVMEGKLYKATFSSHGARLRSFELKGERFKRMRNGKLVPVEMASVTERPGDKGDILPLAMTLKVDSTDKSHQGLVTEDAPYEVVDKTDTSITFATNNASGVRVERTYRFNPDSYAFDMDMRVTNQGSAPVAVGPALTITGWQPPAERDAGGFFSGIPNQLEAACLINGETDRVGYEGFKEETKHVGKVTWAGLDERYFLAAAIPETSVATAGCSQNLVNDVLLTTLSTPLMDLEPQEAKTLQYRFFFGPKDFDLLQEIKAPGAEGSISAQLDQSVDFWILGFLCRPMLWFLKASYNMVGNYGIAIILLTILVKVLLLYWTHKSFKSMKAMQRLKPVMDSLKEKYGDDKQRLNAEMAQMWKKHDVNPLGGCLPMLLQMPVWIALYRTLYASADLYRAPFMLWIQDLSAPDPYLIMPLLLGLTMFVQQKISPTAVDSSQAKIMLYVMPIMFTAFMLFLPAGLTLYILVNTVLSIGQQHFINRTEPPPIQPEEKEEKKKSSPRPEGGGRKVAKAQHAPQHSSRPVTNNKRAKSWKATGPR